MNGLGDIKAYLARWIDTQLPSSLWNFTFIPTGLHGTKTKTFEVEGTAGSEETRNLPALGITPEEQAKIKV